MLNHLLPIAISPRYKPCSLFRSSSLSLCITLSSTMEVAYTKLSPSLHNLSYAVLVFLLPALFLLLSTKIKSKRVKLPPSPPGWPFVGHLFQIARSGKLFFEYVRDLQPKYGPIFTLKLGTQTVIIVTSPEIAHEALIEKGPIFASRPADLPTQVIFRSNKFSITSGVYGSTWRALRRNMVQSMLNPACVKDFYNVRNSAMDKLVNRLRSEAELNHGVVSVLKNARFAVFCILLSMCFGLELSQDTIDKIDETLKDVLLATMPRLDDFLPVLSPFFLKQKKRAIEVAHDHIQTLLPIINKRRSVLQNPGSDATARAFAYIDTLFDLKIGGRKSTPTDAELVTLCAEFLNAGTDTTATAIEWAMARLIQNPDMQSRLYSEIISTVGDRKVDEGDVDKMKYLDAFAKEVLRKHPPTYFLLMHAATEPTKLAGYDIPTGASVNFYTPAIAEDSKIWSNPKEFDPDRFASGAENVDITGVSGVKMLPFGVGRRICPAYGIGTTHLKLMVARMVQEFEWSAPSAESEIGFTATFQFTVVMKDPLRAKIKPRIQFMSNV